jgi:hypothetical protein
MRASPSTIPRPTPSSLSPGRTTSAHSAGRFEKGKVWFFSSLEVVHEDASIAYSPASATQFDALATLAAQGLIPGSEFDPGASERASSLPRLPGHDPVRLDTIHRIAVVSAGGNGQLPHRNDLVQQATLPSTGATSVSRYWSFRAGQPIHLQPNLGWDRSPWDAGTCTTPKRATPTSAFRPGLSLQLHVQLHFRIRDFRRQPIRYAHYGFPRPARSGEIPVPVRCQPCFRPPRTALRGGPDPRTGNERRAVGDGGESHRLPPESYELISAIRNSSPWILACGGHRHSGHDLHETHACH